VLVVKRKSLKQKAFLLDLDGVFYVSEKLIQGGAEIISQLRKKNFPFRFITNTTSKTRKQLTEKLGNLGLDIKEDEIISAGRAGEIYLDSLGSPKCHLLISDELMEDYRRFDCERDEPSWVVIGDRGHNWTYNDINRAFRYIMRGAELLALHKGKYFKVSGGLDMDIGAIVAGLEYVTGKKAISLGKPNKDFFCAALSDLQLPPQCVTMIGDDLINDIGGAQAVGIKSVLVKTGKYDQDILEQSDIVPDAIIDSIAELRVFL
tara:strand:- start:604 stop:1389 length:786 start_codon:yes stop_codon:yes gene_type:complete